MRYYLLLISLALPVLLSAQRDSLPASILNGFENGFKFCTPVYCSAGVTNKSKGEGLLLQYGIREVGFSHSDSDAEATGYSARISAKLKVPVVLRDDLKVLLGLNHARESFVFNDLTDQDNPRLLSSLSDKTLIASRLSLTAFKPFNDKYYFILRLGANYRGDYEQFINFDDRYAMYRGAAMVGWKVRDNLEYGLGALYSQGFRNRVFLPFAFYNQTFNRRWGFEGYIPVNMKLRYNIDSNSLGLLGLEYNSIDYSVDLGGEGYFLRYDSIDLTLTYERNLGSWLWLRVKSGYRYPLGLDVGLLDSGGEVLDTYDETPGFYGRIGFFITP